MKASPATRDMLLTQVTGAPYDPEAKSEVWERFLDQATGGDKDLQDYLQRAVGYSLTGDTREEVLFFVYGPTATGKSTFLEAVKTALGDYAATVDVEAFLAKRFAGGGPSPELAKLRWKRMVVSIEVDEGRHLAEGLIKLVTGGDEISVRGLYRDPESFRPTFKIWLAANNRPRVSDVDDAIWRRIVVIPFTHQVPKANRDKTLKGRLTGSESPAVLAWAVQGCIAWQREGLGRTPKAVNEAVAEYQEEVDILKGWIDELTVESKEALTGQVELYASYQMWAKRTGIRNPLTDIQFGFRLSAKGYDLVRGKGVKSRKGIALRKDKGGPEF